MNRKEHPHRHKVSDVAAREVLLSSSSHHASLAPAEVLFKIDRKGDRQNLKYGSIDKYQIPKYRTAGYGRLVGLDRRFRIASDCGPERWIDNDAHDPSEKSHRFPLHLKQQSDEAVSQLVKPKSGGQQDFVRQQDYVALDGKRRKISGDNDDANGELVGAHKLTDGANAIRLVSESESETEAPEATSDDDLNREDAFELFKNHPDNKKQIELRNQTERDSQDVSAWSELIDHQERYFLLSTGGGKKSLNASQKRAIADMKVSLYEKAIGIVKSGPDRQKLILGLMREGRQIWDTNKQLQQWQLFLQQNKHIELWYEFLNFQQTSAVTFSYERCLEAFSDVQRITQSLSGDDRDHHSAYTVLRLTTFMYQAGYAERAVAIWQALLEYNLLYPKNSDKSLQSFEAFWESECPRVGDEGAKGWCATTQHEAPTRADDPPPTFSEKSLFLAWGRAEAQRSSGDVAPARTLDDTVEDDPYRVILFSDIKDYVFRLETDEGKMRLLQAFLKFCDLPPICDMFEECRQWWTDPFLCEFDTDLQLGTLTDTTALFATQDPSLSIWNMSASIARPLLAFATRASTQLAEIDKTNERLAEYATALQLSQDLRSGRKLAKNLLKHRPESILLYNTYALVEARNNKPDVADNVWSTALSMTTAFASTAQQLKFVLWQSWIWELLERRQHTRALHLLVSALPVEPITASLLQSTEQALTLSPNQHLRADAYLRNELSNSLARSDETIVELTSLLAMLKYLQGDANLDLAISVYGSTLLLLKKQTSLHATERLHQLRARFVHFHAQSSQSGYRPVQMVSILEDSVLAFPDNSFIVHLHERYLRRAGTIDRVRLHSVEGVSPASPTMSSLYSISRELSRPSYSGSTAHSVRRSFTEATAIDSRTRHCAAVWLAWLEWEASSLSDQPPRGSNKKQFKNVYLSALRCCPWRKDLYLQGFVEYDAVKAIGETELEQVYRSMSDRGLRVRHDITELLDDRAQQTW